MADPDRTASDAVNLERELREQPYRFDFYQTLRRLEAIHRERPRLGRSLRPVDDCVRLGQQPSLAFAPSTLASYEQGGGNSRPLLKVNCFGLLGPNGPLPLHLTEYARQRLHHHNDSTFCAFLDMFHHRLLSLFYRAWADSRPTVHRDRPESDRFVSYVGSTFGMGTAALRGRDSVPDTARLFHSGLLACQTRHADGLRLLLEGYFALPLRVEPFLGEWLDVPQDYRLQLGSRDDACRLGNTGVLGTRIWHRAHRFRIAVGPVGFGDYQRLLPGSRTVTRLHDLVRSYVSDELDWDMKVTVAGAEIPGFRLGQERRLGWTTWLTDGRGGGEDRVGIIRRADAMKKSVA